MGGSTRTGSGQALRKRGGSPRTDWHRDRKTGGYETPGAEAQELRAGVQGDRGGRVRRRGLGLLGPGRGRRGVAEGGGSGDVGGRARSSAGPRLRAAWATSAAAWATRGGRRDWCVSSGRGRFETGPYERGEGGLARWWTVWVTRVGLRAMLTVAWPRVVGRTQRMMPFWTFLSRSMASRTWDGWTPE